MKNFLHASALTCAALCLSIGIVASPTIARADGTATVQAAQMRLADLGFYVGRFDGAMGPVTEGAIRDFQRTNGLPSTGNLTSQTYAVLMNSPYSPTYHASVYPDPYVYHHSMAVAPYYQAAYVEPTYHTGYVEPLMVSETPVIWGDRWHYTHSQALPTRYGRLDVNEDDTGSIRHYAITLNGHPVLFANNQPGLLRVSRTYAMDNEDAVVFTAYEGDGVCAYKHYLLTIHSDGSFNNPKEVGNCGSKYEAHVADNALFLSFQRTSLGNAWGTWDVWRYESNALERI